MEKAPYHDRRERPLRLLIASLRVHSHTDRMLASALGVGTGQQSSLILCRPVYGFLTFP